MTHTLTFDYSIIVEEVAMPFKSKGDENEYRRRRRAERTDAERNEDNEKQRESKRRRRAELTDEERLIQNAKRRRKYDENKCARKSSNIEEQQRHIVTNDGDTSNNLALNRRNSQNKLDREGQR